MGQFFAQAERSLTLTVRYLGWLHAIPKPDPRSKRGQRDDDAPKRSRLQQMQADGVEFGMPPVVAPHLLAWFLEMGMTEAAGMSSGPLSWKTISAWISCSGIDLSPWEARLMRRLSVTYTIETRKAEDESCPPPWRAKVTRREAEIEEQQLRMLLG